MSNILVIDDEPNVRLLIRKMLEPEGHTITEAEDGVDGIKKYHKEQIDLIITDIYMPEKEGFETIHELKREYPGIKIVAMSGYENTHLATAKLLGADKVFQKPFDKEGLVMTVREILNRST